MDRFLSTQQVAERLGLHRSTVNRLVAEGFIEARVYTYGSRPTIRIPEEAVERFLDAYVDTAETMTDDEPGDA
ncbi:MAG: helix-turn-helix domain-containing protein [Candidatus Limnocylindrales bacterium]